MFEDELTSHTFVQHPFRIWLAFLESSIKLKMCPGFVNDLLASCYLRGHILKEIHVRFQNVVLPLEDWSCHLKEYYSFFLRFKVKLHGKTQDCKFFIFRWEYEPVSWPWGWFGMCNPQIWVLLWLWCFLISLCNVSMFILRQSLWDLFLIKPALPLKKTQRKQGRTNIENLIEEKRGNGRSEKTQ